MKVPTIKLPLVQERASELFVPVHPSKKAQICLNCPLPKCKPRHCKRYDAELKSIIEEEKKNERN